MRGTLPRPAGRLSVGRTSAACAPSSGARLLREHPSLVVPTEREARVLRLKRAIAEVEDPPERAPLARL